MTQEKLMVNPASLWLKPVLMKRRRRGGELALASLRFLIVMRVQALMEGSDWKDTPLLGRLEVLENLDTQSRVLRGTVSMLLSCPFPPTLTTSHPP